MGFAALYPSYALILRKLSSGMPPEAILADHPRLNLDDIDAAQQS
jgi:uncharacterized protein (DUF433 family)